MERKRGRRVRRLAGRLLVLFLLLVVLVEGTLIIIKRADWRFLAVETVSSWFRHSELRLAEREELTLTFYTREELRSRSVTENHVLELINEEHPIATEFEQEICEYGTSGVWMNESLRTPYAELSAEVKRRFSESLYITSAFRTSEQQQELLQTSAADVAALVGASEHQAGLALDVSLNGFGGRAILKKEAGRYVYTDCWRYGFIIRYPLFQKKKTGTAFEPWHIRYVGMPHAEIIYLEGLVLEEYIERLVPGQFYEYGEYLLTRQKEEPFELPTVFSSGEISPDNTGYYVITVKRNPLTE